MSAIMAFLVYSLLHVPIIVAEKNASDINPPTLEIIGGLDLNHPIIKLSSDQPNATFEVEYLLANADVPILSKSIDGKLEEVPDLAPCRVRARVKVGNIVSKWSRPIQVEWLQIYQDELLASPRY